MTSLERSVIPSALSTRGILYSGFLLLLVVSLFFIPEIIRFQTSFGTRRVPDRIKSPAVVKLEEIIPQTATHPVSSLDRVLQMLDSGNIEETPQRAGAAPAKADAASRSGTEDELTPPDLRALEERVQMEKIVQGDGGFTWDKLMSPQMKKGLRSAQKEGQAILKGLSDRQSSVRFSLINYVNGIAFILRGDKKLMGAEDAVAYIEQLDINVTQAMLSNDVDVQDYDRWKKISLGEVFENGRASALKRANTIGFNPRLTLLDVSVTKQPDFVRSHGQWVRRNASSSLRLAGFVLGKDTKKVAVYHDGRKVGTVHIPKKANDDGMRAFKWRHRTADGVFTFRLLSANGDLYEKSYAFLPKMGRFRQDADGVFVLPFGTRDIDEASLKNLDARLDRYFRVAVRTSEQQGSDENLPYDRF